MAKLSRMSLRDLEFCAVFESGYSYSQNDDDGFKFPVLIYSLPIDSGSSYIALLL